MIVVDGSTLGISNAESGLALFCLLFPIYVRMHTLNHTNLPVCQKTALLIYLSHFIYKSEEKQKRVREDTGWNRKPFVNE